MWRESYSEAYAETKNSGPLDVWDEKVDWVDTFAIAGFPGALGGAWTTAAEVGETVWADTSGQSLPFWAASWADAGRWGEFEVIGDGTLTVSIDYYLEQTLSTETIGDLADGFAGASLELWNDTTSVDDYDDDVIAGGPVADGVSFSDIRFGTFVVSLDFLNGEQGYLSAGVGNGAYVESIPAPGAILLGGIGVGLVGWLRRRRTL